MLDPHKVVYCFVSKKKETPSTYTLYLSLLDDKPITYSAGQCITVYFSDLNVSSGKIYSISSAPHEYENVFSITVRAVGAYSNKLCSLELGDTIMGSVPYGCFNPPEDNLSLVMMAGGIGITPFRSIIFDSLFCKQQRKLLLFHSSQTLEECIFRNDFRLAQEQNKSLQTKIFITRENEHHPHITKRRINTHDIELIKSEYPESIYMISGSVSFVRNQYQNLVELGVAKQLIQTETCM
ncbi:MAG: FAD-dependent oxidoreductase [Candidatus Levybacteria bacterium]|jgi:ferredoxin-NADP reductase|nr:FAD-dependent oxidoreductase [Candidatus Levybacteria bacterium]